MKIQKLKANPGQGVITNHIAQLKAEGYEVLEFRLMQMEETDFNSHMPCLMEDNTIKMFESNFIKTIKNIHSNGGKVAILLEEYENEKERFYTLRKIVENNINHFDLNEDDIIFYTSNYMVSLDTK